MRIIAGERRGHKFDGPKGGPTRPTSDLVRESIFNILGPAVTDLLVVDLFAGTGALGLESLSRGAGRAIFVEKNRDNVGLILRNLATLRFEDRGSVITTDAFRWAQSFTPIDDEPMIVLIDPPYAEYENRPGKIRSMVKVLLEQLPKGSLIVVESGMTLDDTILPEFEAWDIRRYGGTQVAIRAVKEDESTLLADDDSPESPAYTGTDDDDLEG